MLSLSAPSEMHIGVTVVKTFIAKLSPELFYISLFDQFDWPPFLFLWPSLLNFLDSMPHRLHTLFTKAYLNTVPVYNWTIVRKYIHSFIDRSVLKVWRVEEFLQGFES